MGENERGGTPVTGKELTEYIALRFGAEPEYPWDDENCIFRHRENRKWFAVLLRVGWRRLGIDRDGIAAVLNLKCPPQMQGAYLAQPGFLPAYHMNKEHWLSALLDGSAEDEAIRELLELSFLLTRGRRRMPTAPAGDGEEARK